MTELFDLLIKYDAIREKDSIEHGFQDAIQPEYGDKSFLLNSLSEEMQHALTQRQIHRLYRHQMEAIQNALAGKNVVLQAPTASGKSLAFQIPMLESLIQDENGKALMLFPTKALALDQRDQLLNLTKHFRISKIQSWWYDGDVDKETRKVLRKSPPQILITNPDMLNQSFLGHADQWHEFLKGIKWLIIDEIHEYRGYFGSNVSMVLRRFSYFLARLSIFPQFFLSSATCANAREHAENLTGHQFTEVDASHSIRPRRKYHFIQPDIPDHRYWEILQFRVVLAGLACLAAGKSVLVFCPTRKFAESCFPIAKRESEKFVEQDELSIELEQIRVFRSGLDVDERHSIQEGLKSGYVRLVFTTNALELGIDIGGLDGVILAGFPDSMMSALQRIGRAGRNWNKKAFVLYYALNNPLDRFYASNLDAFLKKPLDDLVVNPENENLIERQIPSFLYEMDGDFNVNMGRKILGEGFYDSAKKMWDEGQRPVKTGYWRPHSGINIRGSGGKNFDIKDGSRIIGSLSGLQQFREAYQDAVYMHGGKKFRVVGISHSTEGNEITLGSVEQYLNTNLVNKTTVQEQEIYSGKRWVSDESEIEVEVYYGTALIIENIYSIEEIDERSGETRKRWQPQTNSARFDNAQAYWICIQSLPIDYVRGITVLSQLLRVGSIFSVPLDQHDIFAHANVHDRKAYILESYPGGIGIVRKIIERWRNVLAIGIDVAQNCSCKRGCPNCVVPPRSQEEFDKVAGLSLANLLLRVTQSNANFGFENGLWKKN